MTDDAAPDTGLDAVLYATAPQPSAPPASAPSGSIPAPADDADALTRMLYGEARGEPTLGQIGAAYTAVNRSKQSGKSVASIASDPGTYNGYPQGAGISTDDPAYKHLHDVAESVLSGSAPDPTGGAVHFLNPANMDGPLPGWASGQGYRIGNHVFYGGSETGVADATADLLSGHTASNAATQDYAAKFGAAATPSGKTVTGTTGPGTLTPAPLPSNSYAKIAQDQHIALALDDRMQLQPSAVDPTTGKPDRAPEPGTDAQAQTWQSLAAAGKLDPNATPGSAGLPYALGADGALPPRGGDWYIDRAGKLQQVVDPDTAKDTANAVLQTAINPVQGVVNFETNKGDPRLTAFEDATANNLLLGGGPSVSAAGTLFGQNLAGKNPSTYHNALMDAVQDQSASRARFTLVRDAGAIAGMAADVPLLMAGGPAADAPLALRLANASGRSALYSGTQGFVSTPGDLQQRAAAGGENALLGGTLGLGLEGAPALANKLVGGMAVSPGRAALAQSMMNDFGIPLRAGQISDSPALRYIDSELVKSGPYAKSQAAQVGAFNQALASTIGEDASGLTPEVMSRARARIGSVFNNVASRTTINADDPFVNGLANVETNASQVLGADQMKPLQGQINDILSRVSDNGTIDGPTYQSLTSKGAPLDRAMNSGDPNIRYYAGQVRDVLDDALQRSADPQDLVALSQARLQWKNMRSIQALASKASPDGEISPQLLMQAVRKSYTDMPYSGAGDIGTLAQGAQTFMKDMPDSGTAGRLGAKSILGLASIPVVAEGLGAMLHNPALGMETVGGMGGLWAANKLVQSATAAGLDNPITRNLLLRSAQNAAPAVAATPGSATALLNQANGAALGNNALKAVLLNRLLSQQPSPQPAQ